MEWRVLRAVPGDLEKTGGYSEWGYSESVRIGKSRKTFFAKATISQRAQKYLASQLASLAGEPDSEPAS